MLTFRQKIFISYLVVFLLFIILIFPFAGKTVRKIVRKGMEDRATELIANISHAQNNEALIRKLKESKALIYFRVSLISNERRVLYDSHMKRVLGSKFSQDYIVSHPEVIEAFKNGTGYHEEYSAILNQDFSYFAKSFPYHNKTYVLRIAFPLKYVEEITKDFEFGFLASSIAILILFSAMTWFVLSYLTRPIQQIITAVRPYQMGQTDILPAITLHPKNRRDEFGQLASTMNSLSIKIRNQIDSLTIEKNEKKVILESLGEGVIAVNNHMVITYINAIAAKLLNIKVSNVLNQHLSSINQQQCLNMLERCLKEGVILSETMELNNRAEKIYLDLVGASKTDGTGAILVLQDKTEHHRIIEMRKDFIANASHELKTPITIIRGFAETLHDNPGLPTDTRGDITQKIVNNCEKMNNLIKDLLTLTGIEHISESRLVECDLSHLAENARTTISDAYPEAAIDLVYSEDEDYHILADPNLIELCLSNLVENAAKYSPPPAQITITLGRTEDWATAVIQDKGFGIPQKDLENIFQRFYRSENSRYNKKITGSGLGLSIVEMIIKKHSGKITVSSAEGEGSTFTIYLPINIENP